MEPTLFKKANECFQTGQFDLAIQHYKSLLAQGPKRFFYYQNIALAHAEKNNFRDAEHNARLAVAYAPHLPELKALLDHYLSKNKNAPTSPVLSIIVPVYNVAPYLAPCLNSILAQKINDIEIIIVNDGSTDGSGDIIKEFAARDPRIVVIENAVSSGNPGKPRNQALAIAKGTYIGFVDSDDWIEPDFYKRLVERAQSESADIVFSGGFHRHNNEQTTLAKFNLDAFETKKSAFGMFSGSFMIWDKIYKRELLNRFNIRLGETVAAVDVPFIFKAYFYGQKVSFCPQLTGYHYRIEAPSSVTVNRRKKTPCRFEFAAYKLATDWAAREHLPEYFTHLIQLKKIASYSYTLTLIQETFFTEFFERAQGEIRHISRPLVEQFCQANGDKQWLQRFDDLCQLTADEYFLKYRNTTAGN